jgi:hypothetical protein
MPSIIMQRTLIDLYCHVTDAYELARHLASVVYAQHSLKKGSLKRDYHRD